ncbi:MAG TPA: replicative DNA helicase [Nitrospiria bacterium]|nr:replicative DNA helicase [Nitrospiria bacterium]
MSSTDLIIHKLPPQNIEAEQSILGAILLDNNALNSALEIIIPNDFYKEAHRKIFLGMLDLNERGEAVDLVTLTDSLRRKNELEFVGGASYLSSLVNTVPTSANIRYHSKILHEKALLRNLINVATEIASLGYDGTERVEELLDYAERSIFSISERKIRPSFIPIKDGIKECFLTLERISEGGLRGLDTGFRGLDNLVSGLQPSDLIIVAGRPSMGKTAFALCISQHIGIKKKGAVAIFSLEMSKEQLVLRMLCSESRVDAHKLRLGYLAPSDWKKLTEAAGKLTESRIFIDDTPSVSILEMRAKARRLKAEHGIDLIIVDYLQLMRGTGDADTREQEISAISRSLKALAKELAVPVIALSQLSRAVESRGGDKKPVLADLRESGAIEQDADLVIFIFRKEVYEPCECSRDTDCTCGRRGIAEVLVRKHRNGPTGDVPLLFLDRYTKFEDLEQRHQ